MRIPILNDIHESEGARIVDFAGWRMPVSYTSILKEVAAVRESAGLFDVTHMGRLRISGNSSERFLNYITSNDVSSLSHFQGQYTLLCNDEGGIIDDAIVYRENADTFYIVINASNSAKDKQWMESHMMQDVVIDDLTDSTALYALQGPRSVDILEKIGINRASFPARFWFTFSGWGDKTIAIARTGYTGEDGFEIACDNEYAAELWNAILEAGKDYDIERCGLGSRDVLRIEAGYPLYGNELDENTSPVEAGLARFVKMTKPEFIGKNAIEEKMAAPLLRKLKGLLMEGRAIPRSGDILASGSDDVGIVTSGTWSPTLQKGIGMAYIQPDAAVPGYDVEVVSKGKTAPGKIVDLPIYKRG